MGLLAILDDECQRMSHVTDETFLVKVGHTFHSNPLVEIVHRGQTAAIKPCSSVLPTTDAFRYFN